MISDGGEIQRFADLGTDDDQITLYNSLGITAQDLFAAHHVYQAALKHGLGVSLDFG